MGVHGRRARAPGELPPELQAKAVLGLAIEQSAAVQGAAGRARRVHARHCGPRPRRSARRAAERCERNAAPTGLVEFEVADAKDHVELGHNLGVRDCKAAKRQVTACGAHAGRQPLHSLILWKGLAHGAGSSYRWPSLGRWNSTPFTG